MITRATPLGIELLIEEGMIDMGVLEDLIEALNANTNAILTSGGSSGSTTTKAATTGKGKTKITADDLTKIVQPLVEVPAKKAKVRAVLDSMGIPRLGEAKEEQYVALKEAFEAIRDEASASEDII